MFFSRFEGVFGDVFEYSLVEYLHSRRAKILLLRARELRETVVASGEKKTCAP